MEEREATVNGGTCRRPCVPRGGGREEQIAVALPGVQKTRIPTENSILLSSPNELIYPVNSSSQLLGIVM